jgi:hypothetical protein
MEAQIGCSDNCFDWMRPSVRLIEELVHHSNVDVGSPHHIVDFILRGTGFAGMILIHELLGASFELEI